MGDAGVALEGDGGGGPTGGRVRFFFFTTGDVDDEEAAADEVAATAGELAFLLSSKVDRLVGEAGSR